MVYWAQRQRHQQQYQQQRLHQNWQQYQNHHRNQYQNQNQHQGTVASKQKQTCVLIVQDVGRLGAVNKLHQVAPLVANPP